MKKSSARILFSILILLLVTLACGSSAGAPAPAADLPTQPPPPPLVTVDAALTSTPTEESAPVIQHTDIPPADLPAEPSSVAGDQDSSVTAEEKRAPSGDRFTFGRYERPFNADTMDVYYPYLDIQTNFLYKDDSWLYAVITLKGGDQNQSLAGKYGVEFDLDVDGRGDWLITAGQPSSMEWSTDRVQAWFDTNKDVGGDLAVNADEKSDGNGYETNVFDSGQGSDPDAAWARVSPQDPNTVQIAVKRSLFDGDETLMAGVWAGSAVLDPALFDLNDHFTQDQAGSSLVEFEFYYPVKAISEVDNACRVALGFQPSGNEPGLCPLPPQEKRDKPPSDCPPERVYCVVLGNQTICYCLNP